MNDTRVIASIVDGSVHAVCLYDAQAARLKYLGSREGWNYLEFNVRDVIGLPRHRVSHAWMMCESAVEAFEVAKDLLSEVALYAVGLMVREMEESSMWYVNVEAKER